jgi:segregation and condensation protein A
VTWTPAQQASGDSGAPGPTSPELPESGFQVRLDNFEGPFDLLLGLISKHKLDVTEVALSKVTDDFIAHIRAGGPEWDLGQATGFLVVAATLLDLKAARLLPAADVENEEDLALLEARDLLFARLLQYRAYKEVSGWLAARFSEEGRRFPRAVGMEERFAGLLPEVLLGLGPEEFARLAARALAPRAVPTLPMDHVHAIRVSVRDQAALLVERLRRVRTATFRSLIADCPDTLHVVARFLAILELYRESAVSFDQVHPLGELHVRWTGSDEGELAVDDEFDVDDPESAAEAETVAEAVAPAGAGRPAGAGDGGDSGDGHELEIEAADRTIDLTGDAIAGATPILRMMPTDLPRDDVTVHDVEAELSDRVEPPQPSRESVEPGQVQPGRKQPGQAQPGRKRDEGSGE